MSEIKLISKDTDLKSLIKLDHILDWDVVIYDIPYYVIAIPGYVHTISYSNGLKTEIDLWAWPRDEKPSFENIIEFDPGTRGPIEWGITYKESFQCKTKHDETEAVKRGHVVITRNGRTFYSFPGDMGVGIDHARLIIDQVKNCDYINYSALNYVNTQILGRYVWYKGYKAVIDYYCEGQGCIILKYAGPKEYEQEAHAVWHSEDNRPKLDIIRDIHCVDWFKPELIH